MEQDSYKLNQLIRAKAEAELAALGLSSKASEGILNTDLLYITKRPLADVDSRIRDALSNAAEALNFARNRCALLSLDDIYAELAERRGKGADADGEAALSEEAEKAARESAAKAYISILDPAAVIFLEADELPKLPTFARQIRIPNFIKNIDDSLEQKKAWELMKCVGHIPK